MKYHFLFLALCCLNLFTINSETLQEKKFFEITGDKDDKIDIDIITCSGGDVNGDGYPDILVTPGKNLAYLIYGGPTESLNDLQLTKIIPKQGFKLEINDVDNQYNKFRGVSLVDLNKDGYVDLILTAGRSSQWRRTYVVFGGPSLTDINVDSMNSTQGFVITADEEEGDSFNNNVPVRPAGDVNGDGYQDLLVRLYEQGPIYLIYGGSSLSSFNVRNMTSKQGCQITHSKEHRWFDVSSSGDINNDGYADVLVSWAEDDGFSYVYAMYGGKSLASFDIATVQSDKSFIVSMGYAFPKVSSAGDVNRDGYADMLIGVRDTGEAYIVYGGKALSSFDISDLTENQGVKITGHNELDGVSSSLGYFVRSAGDFNKDGYADVIIGAPLELSEHGAAYIIYGGKSLSNVEVAKMTKTQGLEITKPGKSGDWYDNFAMNVHDLGDLNKDGYDDVVVTDHDHPPTVYVIFGAPNV